MLDSKTQFALLSLMLVQNKNITIGEAGSRLNRIKATINGVCTAPTITKYKYKVLK
jgi:hypothetical protein